MTSLKVIAGEQQESRLHDKSHTTTFTATIHSNSNNNIDNDEVMQCIDVPRYVS